jgi:small multidrug resistance pump
MKWLYLFIAILAEVIATSALTPSAGFTRLVPSLLVVVGYGLAFFFMSLALKGIPVGVAYAIWSGIGMALIAVVGYVIFKQKLDLAAIVGILMIMGGVLVITLLSKNTSY